MNDVHDARDGLPSAAAPMWRSLSGSLRLLGLTAMFALVCGLPDSIKGVIQAITVLTA